MRHRGIMPLPFITKICYTEIVKMHYKGGGWVMRPENLTLADYGIVIFAVGGLITTITTLSNVIKAWVEKKNPSGQAPYIPRCSDSMRPVIENNTRAMEENTKSNQELQTIIKVFVAEQTTKMDEVLTRIR